MEILKLAPNDLWKYFAALNAIPRASKKEEKVIQFIVDFGKSLGLETVKDSIGNVIIKKPATKGLANAPVVVLQSHLDMVHQKNNDTQFDFDTQGIEMYIDGDWVKAKGTTLGADNGIGVASIMAILASDEIVHPAIEALFTIDEETGMTGAKELDSTILKGEMLLNLDTEDDTEITIGCAGGIDITASLSYEAIALKEDEFEYYQLNIKGLNGGHSGMEIHKGLGNANKIMNRILFYVQERMPVYIATIHGGGLRNAIPRESQSIIAINKANKATFEAQVLMAQKDITAELSIVDPGIQIKTEVMTLNKPLKVLPLSLSQQLVKSIYAAPNGVYKMSSSFEGLVETSNNIANIVVENGQITIKCLTRSSVYSSKMDLANAIKSSFELMGATITFSGEYPGWSPNPSSKALAIISKVYAEKFGTSPHVAACHAGLECGILAGHYPKLDMVSFGPTILGAHSPDERVSITSVQKFWSLLLATLATLGERQ